MIARLPWRQALLGSALLLATKASVAQTTTITENKETSTTNVVIDYRTNAGKKADGPKANNNYQVYNDSYRSYHNYRYNHGRYADYSYNKPTYAKLGVTMVTEDDAIVLRRVTSDHAAALAGLQSGDRIESFANVKVTSINQLIALIQHHKGGETVPVVYERDGQTNSTNVTLETVTNQRRQQARELPCDQVQAVKERPFLGIYMRDNHSNWEEQTQATVRITEVIPNTGADRSTLQDDDEIIAMDGERIKDTKAARAFIRSHRPGDNIVLEVLRGEQVLKVPATIGHYGESQAGRKVLDMQEPRCEAYNDPKQACDLLQQYTGISYLGIYMSRSDIDNGNGTLVTAVVNGTAAERGQLMGGDRIIRMDDQPISDFKSAIAFIDSKQPGDQVTIVYVRGDATQTTTTVMGSMADKTVNAPHVAYLEQLCEEQVDEPAKTADAEAASAPLAAPSAPNVMLFPNPSNTVVNIVYEGNAAPLTVTVTNLDGKALYNQTVSQFDGQYNQQIDVSDFPAGLYLISFVQDDGITTKQLVVQ